MLLDAIADGLLDQFRVCVPTQAVAASRFRVKTLAPLRRSPLIDDCVA